MRSQLKWTTIHTVLVLLIFAAVSFFFAAHWFPESTFVQKSLEQVEKSSDTVMGLEAATMSASLAITAFPDDFATPLAQALADMNIYFIAILIILLCEKLLLLFGVRAVFRIAIPLACILGILSVCFRKDVLKTFAIRLAVLAFSVAFVVPCSTWLSGYVASEMTAYVEETIAETQSGADKLNEAMAADAEDATIFDKLSDLFKTAITGISDLIEHFQNILRRCMNSIAILILTNFIIPLLNFYFLKWIFNEIAGIITPSPVAAVRHSAHTPRSSDPDREPLAIGE